MATRFHGVTAQWTAAVSRRWMLLAERGERIVARLDAGLATLAFIWVAAASAAVGLRVAADAPQGRGATWALVGTLMPYGLVVGLPAMALAAGLHLFADGSVRRQPRLRLARAGRWTTIGVERARRHPRFGLGGLMASLLIGILLNVPVHMAEFVVGMPALVTASPQWYRLLYAMMLGDVLILTSGYAFVFALALRCVPIFPRCLAGMWSIDLALQIIIARTMAESPQLPMAVRIPLHDVLQGNLRKTLISVALWLPYLMLSRRVNVTYRWRIRRR